MRAILLSGKPWHEAAEEQSGSVPAGSSLRDRERVETIEIKKRLFREEMKNRGYRKQDGYATICGILCRTPLVGTPGIETSLR